MPGRDKDHPPGKETKLTRAKRRWAREGRFLTGRTARPEAERLPPGQRLVRDWPVLDLGEHSEVTLDAWRLTIDGAVEQPLIWSWEDFRTQPQSRKITDIHCVTSWSRFDNEWEGVAAQDILAAVRPRPEARFVMLHSHDEYTANLTLEDFGAADALIAHSWQGEPLTRAHGGPARLVIPHLYFWKSAKWIRRIEFSVRPMRGLWEANGYHDRGDPWREQRYAWD